MLSCPAECVAILRRLAVPVVARVLLVDQQPSIVVLTHILCVFADVMTLSSNRARLHITAVPFALMPLSLRLVASRKCTTTSHTSSHDLYR